MIKILGPNRYTKMKMNNLLYVVLFFSLLYRFFVDYLHVFSAVRYGIDLCFLIMIIILCEKKIIINRSRTVLFKYCFIYFLYCFLTYFLHFESLSYFVYGIIYWFRYPLFALLCVISFDETDADKCLKYVSHLFYINVVLVLVQHFGYGLYGDYLGGIFGKVQGCNGYMNVYLIAMNVYFCFQYLNKQEKIWSLFLKIGISLFIAAIAELKFFFVEFIVLVVFAVFFTGFSWKKILIGVGATIGIVFGFSIFATMYSYGKDFLNIDVWIQLASSGAYSSGYSGSGEVNRLTFASVISEYFFDTPLKEIVGLGIGNCSFSNIPLFNTSFYERFKNVRYSWFTSSYVLLEQGWIGFCLYIGYFIFVFIYAIKAIHDKKINPTYCYMASAMSIMAVLMMLYNNSLNVESGFLLYFFTTLPFLDSKKVSIRSSLE